MAIYVMFTTLTNEGRKTIEYDPNRIKQVNKEVEAMGVKIVAQYVLMGHYDFVNILDAPDIETMMKVAMNLGARGTLVTTTNAAMSIEQFINAMG